jgi:hypothetical protein
VLQVGACEQEADADRAPADGKDRRPERREPVVGIVDADQPEPVAIVDAARPRAVA